MNTENANITATRVTSWTRVLNAARSTVNKKPLTKEPSDEFKRRMVVSEHTPLRLLEFDITLDGVSNEVVGHLVRHNQGVEKFVSTLRDDRTNVNPEDVTYLTPRKVTLSCNAQALINISRKRLCCKAMAGTRRVWFDVKSEINKIDPIVASAMVRECVYRGFCPEYPCCGFVKTEPYKKERESYETLKGNDAG